jgi:hypothetical protein
MPLSLKALLELSIVAPLWMMAEGSWYFFAMIVAAGILGLLIFRFYPVGGRARLFVTVLVPLTSIWAGCITFIAVYRIGVRF